MIILQKIYFDKSLQTKILAVCSVIVLLTAPACTLPLVPASGYSAPVQPESPLIPGDNTLLSENRWRLVEATYHGEAVELDAIQPIYFRFTGNGQLGKSTTNCNSGSYYIIAESTHRYRLMSWAATAIDCGEVGNRQYDRLSEVLTTTTEYEIQEKQLFLMSVSC